MPSWSERRNHHLAGGMLSTNELQLARSESILDLCTQGERILPKCKARLSKSGVTSPPQKQPTLHK